MPDRPLLNHARELFLPRELNLGFLGHRIAPGALRGTKKPIQPCGLSGFHVGKSPLPMIYPTSS
jgi:hypothetical protein